MANQGNEARKDELDNPTGENLRDIQNVERVFVEDGRRYGADPKRRRRNLKKRVGNVRSSSTRTSPRGRSLAAAQRVQLPNLSNAAKLVDRWTTFSLVVGSTTKFYFVQVFFGVLCLIGYALLGGLEASYLFSAADLATFGSIQNIGGGLFTLGAAGAFLFGGMIIYTVALGFYSARGQNFLGIFSPLVVVFCMVALLCPLINLFPIMWLWCLYMTIADEGV